MCGCKLSERLRTCAARHRLGQAIYRFAVELADVPVAGKAHLRESHEVYVPPSGLFDEGREFREVGACAAGGMLKLYAGGSKVVHEIDVAGLCKKTGIYAILEDRTGWRSYRSFNNEHHE
jgi:hypothetical protein